jgi:hypothetical protein
VRQLLRLLLRDAQGARAVWRVVPVPAVDAADQRHRHRDLETLQQERARTTPRIQGVRSRQGVRLTSRSQWPAPREALRLWEGAPLPRGVRRRVLRVSAPHQFLRPQSAAGEAARRPVRHTSQAANLEQVRQWMPLRGLGSNGSWVVVRAFFGGRAVKHRREGGG